MKIVLLSGPSAAGKSFMTDRVLALDYEVLTERLDSLYPAALKQTEIPPRPDGLHSVYDVAHGLRQDGVYDPEQIRLFFERLEELLRSKIELAKDLGVDLVLEGYSARFADEVRLIRDTGRSVCGDHGIEVTRINVKPPPSAWHHNRASRYIGYTAGRYDEKMAAPDAVDGVRDYVVETIPQLKKRAEDDIKLRPHHWQEGFSLGPVRVDGPIDVHEKISAFLDRDIVAKDVLDLCCGPGVSAILMKLRGAAKVVGIEPDPVRYAKALALRSTLKRGSGVGGSDDDGGAPPPPYTRVELRRGDIAAELRSLEAFDTVSLSAAVHRFPDRHAILRSVGQLARDAVYIESPFADPGRDAVDAGDREALRMVLARTMPEFEIEAEIPLSREGASWSEIWRLRR